MGDLISREALLDELSRDIDFECESNATITAMNAFKIAMKRAKKLPAVDAEPVRRGEWIRQDNTYTRYVCSKCRGRNYPGGQNYCPNCGARMKEETNE